jgi:hypothetical protein
MRPPSSYGGLEDAGITLSYRMSESFRVFASRPQSPPSPFPGKLSKNRRVSASYISTLPSLTGNASTNVKYFQRRLFLWALADAWAEQDIQYVADVLLRGKTFGGFGGELDQGVKSRGDLVE